MTKKLEGAGLRGQSAGQTSLSTVEQEGSLRYLGYSIEDLAKNASFEEVAYLLLLGQLPNSSQLHDFENELFELRTMPASLVSVLESIPSSAHPMEVIRTIISYMGVIEPEESFEDQLHIAKRLLGVTTSAIVYWYKFSHKNKKIDQETRLFDTKKNETRSMRSKEDAHDYRYFPDPDLLPLKLEQKLIDDLKKSLPELPDKKKERFVKEYGLNAYEANVLVSEKEISDYYEEVAKLSDKKLAATWMMGDLFAMLNDRGLDISKSPISAKHFAELVQAIKSGEISGRIAKEVFEIMVESGDNPKKIIESKGMKQQSDPKELEKMINEILSKNKDKVDQYKAGKEKLFGFFVGQVMKLSGGKANPQLTNEILKKLLKG